MQSEADINVMEGEALRERASCWEYFEIEECLPLGECECGAWRELALISDWRKMYKVKETAAMYLRKVPTMGKWADALAAALAKFEGDR